MSSNESLIRALITHGADAEIVDGYGQTALDICKVKKDNNLITTLLDSVDSKCNLFLFHVHLHYFYYLTLSYYY